ncbi:iduronate 2-sulfatase-like [Oscarella lobularis]|uniref:iduronate 2-sulfatase-like n=1 Tax=Oscarella lobularis TaxID=121494 RepID=UPI0033135927
MEFSVRFVSIYLLTLVSFGDAKFNVLMIAVDDLRPELHSYGIKGILTPNINKLASTSLQFDRAYCQQAICNPTRTSLLTSRRPDSTKVWDLAGYWRHLGGNFTSLPEYFKSNGYRTAGMGKVYHDNQIREDVPYSWTEPYFHAPAQRRYGCCGNRTSSWWAVDNSVELPDEQIAQHAVETLQMLKNAQNSKNETKPFFVAVGFRKPHLPFFAPQKFYDLYPEGSVPLVPNRYRPKNMPEVAWNPLEGLRFWNDFNSLNVSYPDGLCPDEEQLKLRRAYYACVSYMDAQVGKVLSELESLGLENDTIVIFWGDHGWQLGEHGEWGKYTNWEMGTHVPLFFRVPGMKTAGQRTSAFVEYVDIFPSLADAAGLPVPPQCQPNMQEATCTEGVSFLPLTENSTRKWKTAAFSQYPRPSVRGTLAERRYCGASCNPSYCDTMGYTMRTYQYRYTEWIPFNATTGSVHWDHPRAVELYDHQSDEGENDNIASSANKSLLSQLAQELRSGWRAHLPPF